MDWGEQREKPSEFWGAFGIGTPLLWSLGEELCSGLLLSLPPVLPRFLLLLPLSFRRVIVNPSYAMTATVLGSGATEANKALTPGEFSVW